MGAVLCYPHDTESWGGYGERCRFDDETATVLINDSIPFLLRPYDQVIFVRYTREDRFTIVQDISSYTSSPTAQRTYQPDQLLIPNSDLPPRILTMFGN
jgi:hypothetical protein